MLIIISPDELVEEFRNSWKMGSICHPSIDFADNAIYAIFEKRIVTIFHFSSVGVRLDNRRNGYTISSGEAGIVVSIK